MSALAALAAARAADALAAGAGSLPWWAAGAALALCVGAASGCGWWLARRAAGAQALAQRADRNGQALLRLADEIECHLLGLEQAGVSIRAQRHWPGQCRRLALAHLECINHLMLEGGRPPSVRRRLLP